MNAKDVLNELKWRVDRDLSYAIIHYVHRGAPNDERVISGEVIEELDSSHLISQGSTIPYHRIFRIEYEDEVIFEREK